MKEQAGYCIEVSVQLHRPTKNEDRMVLMQVWGNGLSVLGLLSNPVVELKTLHNGTARECLCMLYHVPVKQPDAQTIYNSMRESLAIHGYDGAGLEVTIHIVEYRQIERIGDDDTTMKGVLAA